MATHLARTTCVAANLQNRAQSYACCANAEANQTIEFNIEDEIIQDKHQEVKGVQESSRCQAQARGLHQAERADYCAAGREQRRRTRRLVALLGHWSSASEMQLHTGAEIDLNRTPTPSSSRTSIDIVQQSAPVHADRCRACASAPITGSREGPAICASTSIPFATEIGAPDFGYGVPARKLWQSLVLPLVLACIILLVALWTRQVSLALTNDTLTLMIVLVAVFVTMSCVAFWLSRDQAFRHLDTGGQHERAEHSRPANHSPHHRRHHYHDESQPHYPEPELAHQGGHHHPPNDDDISSGRRIARAADDKSCGISVIDCQPPDYYSAVTSSLPVVLFDAELNDLAKSATDSASELYLSPWNSPPSYADISRPNK